VPDRQRLADRLERLGVLSKPYFPAQHLHHEVSDRQEHLPVTERLDREALALPMSSELSRRQVERVAAALERSHRAVTEHRRDA
jgi:dTDP-4-amino-4,6-dideoxygalactose transaminase